MFSFTDLTEPNLWEMTLKTQSKYMFASVFIKQAEDRAKAQGISYEAGKVNLEINLLHLMK